MTAIARILSILSIFLASVAFTQGDYPDFEPGFGLPSIKPTQTTRTGTTWTRPPSEYTGPGSSVAAGGLPDKPRTTTPRYTGPGSSVAAGGLPERPRTGANDSPLNGFVGGATGIADGGTLDGGSSGFNYPLASWRRAATFGTINPWNSYQPWGGAGINALAFGRRSATDRSGNISAFGSTSPNHPLNGSGGTMSAEGATWTQGGSGIDWEAVAASYEGEFDGLRPPASATADQIIEENTRKVGGGMFDGPRLIERDLAAELFYGDGGGAVEGAVRAQLDEDQIRRLDEELAILARREPAALQDIITASEGPVEFSHDADAARETAEALFEENSIVYTMYGINDQRLREPDIAYAIQKIAEESPGQALGVRMALTEFLSPQELAEVDRQLAGEGSFGDGIDVAIRHDPVAGATGFAKGAWNNTFGWALDGIADAGVSVALVATEGFPSISPEGVHRNNGGIMQDISLEDIASGSVVELEFEYDNIAEQGGADAFVLVEVVGGARAGVTLVRRGSRYFLRSGDELVELVGPSTPGQLQDALELGNALPPVTATRPNPRHFLDNINQSTVAKPVNTVIEPGVDVTADIAAINRGDAVLENGEYLVNGRRYRLHDNGTAYPTTGDGLHQLTRQEFKVLQTLQGHPDINAARQIAIEHFSATPEMIRKIEAIMASGG